MRKIGKQPALKDKGMVGRSPGALRGRQANLHSFFRPENNTGGDSGAKASTCSLIEDWGGTNNVDSAFLRTHLRHSKKGLSDHSTLV
jgi:hypothetical protein